MQAKDIVETIAEVQKMKLSEYLSERMAGIPQRKAQATARICGGTVKALKVESLLHPTAKNKQPATTVTIKDINGVVYSRSSAVYRELLNVSFKLDDHNIFVVDKKCVDNSVEETFKFNETLQRYKITKIQDKLNRTPTRTMGVDYFILTKDVQQLLGVNTMTCNKPKEELERFIKAAGQTNNVEFIDGWVKLVEEQTLQAGARQKVEGVVFYNKDAGANTKTITNLDSLKPGGHR